MRQTRLTTQLSNLAKNDREMLLLPERARENRDKLLRRINILESESFGGRQSFVSVAYEFVAAFLPLRTVTAIARTMSIALLAIVSVVGGGIVSAAAYKDSVPGEALYGAKLTVEAAQLFVASNLTAKTKLYTEFADTRIEEVTRLAENGNSTHAAIEEAIKGYGVALSGVRQGIDELGSRSADTTTEVAKLVERKLVAHQEALGRVRVLVPELSSEIGEARRKADSVSLTSMALLVERHLAGQARPEIVSQRFVERIKSAEGEVDDALAQGEVTEDVAMRARAAIAEAKQLVQDANYQAALLKIVEATGTIDDEENVEEVVEEEGVEVGVLDEEEVVEENVEELEEVDLESEVIAPEETTTEPEEEAVE